MGYPYQVDVLFLDDYDDGWWRCRRGEMFRMLWVTFRALRRMQPNVLYLLSTADASRLRSQPSLAHLFPNW